ncbi:MAG: PorT family protein [Bacteroidales bacterium]|nr:PorT family protein [Bacteroidales bacterium]
MRKIILIIVLAFVGTMTYAQLGFGLKGAITMSKLSTDIDDYKESLKAGYQLGAYVRIGDKLHLQPEVYFTAKTGKLEGPVSTGQTGSTAQLKQDITLQTIDIPVMVGYRILNPPLVKVRLQAGPVASVVLNKKFDISLDGVDQGDPSDDYKDSFKNMNWGLQFGAGVDILFITADIRYELGLNNIYKKPEDATVDQTFKNNVFFLSVGFKIL